ncbi:hypothetical protein KDK77_10245 [bacterium]|nr:hypothetical protein [bacterium]MCP5462584.1 hypothetical protein [bacterium]
MPTKKIERGISYFGIRFPDHAYRDLEAIRQAGCTYVVHTLSEEDIQFNLSNMEKIVVKTKDLGLQAHLDPWGVAGIFGGETFSRYVALKPEVQQVASDGKRRPLACINHPDLWNLMYSWINAAVDIGADVIFWDEPHFFVPGWLDDTSPKDVWGCRCSICQQKFRVMFNEPMPHEETADVLAFKKASLLEFLGAMFRYTNRKNTKNTLCLLPDEKLRDSGFWEPFVALPHLDGFGTDPYWIRKKQSEPDFNLAQYIRPFCVKVRQLAGKYGIRGHIWVQNFSIPNGWENDIADVIDIILSEGIKDISAWSYYGTKGMGILTSSCPETVWKTLSGKYLEIENNKAVIC